MTSHTLSLQFSTPHTLARSFPSSKHRPCQACRGYPEANLGKRCTAVSLLQTSTFWRLFKRPSRWKWWAVGTATRQKIPIASLDFAKCITSCQAMTKCIEQRSVVRSSLWYPWRWKSLARTHCFGWDHQESLVLIHPLSLCAYSLSCVESWASVCFFPIILLLNPSDS